MNKDSGTQERYVCEECGADTLVPNEHCPNCGAPMSALHDESKSKPATETNDDDLTDDTITAGESSSLEDLQEKERAEDEDEYRKDTYGDDE